MSKHLLLAIAALALTACGQQSANTDRPETTTVEGPAAVQPAAMSDAGFVQTVANSDAFEIQSSELAATRAGRQQVKDFAAMMVRDHSSTTQQLTTLAPAINLAAPAPVLDGEMQRKLDGLRNQDGEAFDDAYLDAQVEAHENAIRAFEQYVAGAQPGRLRDWANSTLPKLREHLQQVQGLENAT
jgi:putative membrane protein